MSREIRFRVWDTIAETMTYPDQGTYCITMIGCVCDDETDSGGILENRDYRCEAMQFTGLQDKNGKDIYESDLLDGYFLCKVEWSNEDGGFVVSNIASNGGAMLHQEYADHFEVIGNIYEDKDLI